MSKRTGTKCHESPNLLDAIFSAPSKHQSCHTPATRHAQLGRGHPARLPKTKTAAQCRPENEPLLVGGETRSQSQGLMQDKREQLCASQPVCSQEPTGPRIDCLGVKRRAKRRPGRAILRRRPGKLRTRSRTSGDSTSASASTHTNGKKLDKTWNGQRPEEADCKYLSLQ